MQGKLHINTSTHTHITQTPSIASHWQVREATGAMTQADCARRICIVRKFAFSRRICFEETLWPAANAGQTVLRHSRSEASITCDCIL